MRRMPGFEVVTRSLDCLSKPLTLNSFHGYLFLVIVYTELRVENVM